MKYIDLWRQLHDFVVFSLGDVRKIEPNFDGRRLTEWQEKGYIKKIVRGYYLFSDNENKPEEMMFLIANKIYRPSYISFETALSYYGIIPEGVYQITSAVSKKTATFHTQVGDFVYRSVKPQLMFGYVLVPYQKQNICLADKEKTLLDYLYLNSDIKTEIDLAEKRINPQSIKNGFDIEKFNKYLSLFANKQLAKRANKLLKFINHA